MRQVHHRTSQARVTQRGLVPKVYNSEARRASPRNFPSYARWPWVADAGQVRHREAEPELPPAVGGLVRRPPTQPRVVGLRGRPCHGPEVLEQPGLVVLDRQQVVAPGGHDLGGDAPLAAGRVDAHQRPRNVE